MKTLKRIGWFILLSALQLFFVPAFAQTTVSGTVSDPMGGPLVGVSIQAKGKIIGTTTNEAGQFTVRVNDRLPLISIGHYPTGADHHGLRSGGIGIAYRGACDAVAGFSPQPSFYDALQSLKEFDELLN